MSISIVYTDIYAKRKDAFLARHNNNAMLFSAIKRIERKLNGMDALPESNVAVIREETHFKHDIYAVLLCVCLVNHGENAVAPCCLCFAGDFSNAQRDNKRVLEALRQTAKELDWH